MSERKLDIFEINLKWKVDIRNESRQWLFSPEFQFNGATWILNFRYYANSSTEFRLYLCKYSNGVIPPPFHASVRVERAGTERIESVLSQETLFASDEFTDARPYADRERGLIYNKPEDEVRRAVPEFRLDTVLELLVFLKVEGDYHTPAGQASVATQIQCSMPEGIELPCMESLLEDYSKLMVQGPDPDVEFRCAGQSIRAHGTIVCARSPVIASMLASDMVEGRTRIINIPDMTPDVFRHFLKYIYTGKLLELTFEVALSLYESGNQYAVLGLARRCSRYLAEHLSIQNACDVLAVADAHSDKDLIENVIVYMLKTKVPLASDRWSAFSDNYPMLANRVLRRGWAFEVISHQNYK